MKKGLQEIWASCNSFGEKCDGGSLCHNEIKCYWESDNDGNRVEVEWEKFSLNDWLRIRFGGVSKTARNQILQDHWKKQFENEYDNSDEFEDPDGCGECRENEIFETIINKMHNEWFKGTDEDDEDLEGMVNYLEPTLYDEFIDSNDEEYKERKYSIGPGEVYRKIEISGVEELSRTRGNIATIKNDDKEESYNET
ncbi:hypothetical protein Tco_0646403 [Tanacetum coccineum]